MFHEFFVKIIFLLCYFKYFEHWRRNKLQKIRIRPCELQYAVAYSTDPSYSFLEVHRIESSKISKITKEFLQNYPFFSNVTDLQSSISDLSKNRL